MCVFVLFQLPLKNETTVQYRLLLSCQSRVMVTSCFVYKVIRDLEWIDHLFINPIRRIGLINKQPFDSRYLKWSVHDIVVLSNCKQNICLVESA